FLCPSPSTLCHSPSSFTGFRQYRDNRLTGLIGYRSPAEVTGAGSLALFAGLHYTESRYRELLLAGHENASVNWHVHGDAGKSAPRDNRH
uniref:hypothetical protein n=1 Tax=Cupriavidus taiwanensis TaxID=164546 RepID=UPI001F120CD4